MIVFAICDDNRTILDEITLILTDICRECGFKNIIKTFTNGEDLLMSEECYDIVILDIDMGCGINGIQAGQELKKHNKDLKIIYLTSFSDYMKDAFNNIHAYAYLSKPINCIEVVDQIKGLLDSLGEKKEDDEKVKFMVMDSEYNHKLDASIKYFDVKDIYYFEYVNRKVKIKLKDEQYFILNSMKEITDKMSGYSFVDCHQSFLVNMRNVKTYKGYTAVMKNGEEIPIAQKRSSGFRRAMNEFINNM